MNTNNSEPGQLSCSACGGNTLHLGPPKSVAVASDTPGDVLVTLGWSICCDTCFAVETHQISSFGGVVTHTVSDRPRVQGVPLRD